MKRLFFIGILLLLSFYHFAIEEANAKKINNHSLELSENYFLQSLAIRKMFEGEANVIVGQYCQKGGTYPFGKESILLSLQKEEVSFEANLSLSPVGGNSCSNFFRIASTKDLGIIPEEQTLFLTIFSSIDTQTFCIKFSPAQYIGEVQIKTKITQQKEKINAVIEFLGYKEKIQDVSLVLLPAYEREAEKRISRVFLGFRNLVGRGSISTRGLSGQYCLFIVVYNSKGDILGTEEQMFVF